MGNNRRVPWYRRKNALIKTGILFLIFFVPFILVHEYIMEGYFFDPSDLFSPSITHEKIVIVSVLLMIILSIKLKLKKIENLIN